jgi:hypothetical protein
MTVFDLIFILVFLSTAVTLLVAASLGVSGHRRQAVRILRIVALGWGLYLATVIAGSIFLPRRVLKMGEPRCFDEICIAIDSFQTKPAGSNASYTVGLALASNARRQSQRENDLVFYLSDTQGNRYDPLGGELTKPSTVLLQPQSSVSIEETFLVPAATNGIGGVIAHEGGFPIRWFIIGEEAWFRKPAIVPLQTARPAL